MSEERRRWISIGRHRTRQEVSVIDAGRLVGFSDGVFAIAITLLVLSLPVPSLDSPTSSELWVKLQDDLPEFGAYLLSFAVIGMFWISHHQLLGWVEKPDRGLAVLNLAYLAVIVFIPFPTELVGRYGNDFSAFAIYASTMALAGLMSLSINEYINRKGLLRAAAPRYRESDRLIASLVPAGVFIGSIPLFPLLGTSTYYLFLLLAVVNPSVRRIDGGKNG